MPRKNESRRKPAVRAKERLQAVEMTAEGMNQTEIANQLGISQKSVSHDLSVLTTRWREAAIVQVGELILKELERLADCEAKYLEGWMESRGFDSVDDLRGRLSVSRRLADPAAFFRAQYFETLTKDWAAAS